MREIRMQQEIIVRATNEIGAMARIIRILGDMGINLLSVVVKTEGDETTLHLVTSSQSFARDALRKADFIVEERDVLVVELPHYPGFLCRVGEALARKGILAPTTNGHCRHCVVTVIDPLDSLLRIYLKSEQGDSRTMVLRKELRERRIE